MRWIIRLILFMNGPDDFNVSIDPDLNYFEDLYSGMNELQLSNYISINDYNAINYDKNIFSTMSYNIRSFSANSDTFFSMFHNQNSYPDVLNLTETWFQDSNVEEIPGYKSYHTFRTSGRSGGVSLYIKNDFPSRILGDLCISNDIIEICCVEVTVNTTSFCILGIYRPHSGSIANFSEFLSDILENQSLNNKVCIIVGDLNINIINEDPQTNNFIYNMHSNHFLPIITKPTRFPNSISSQPSLIDHIWLNTLNYKFYSGIIMNDLTNHCPIYIHHIINNARSEN